MWEKFDSLIDSGGGTPAESTKRANQKSPSSASPIVVIGITTVVVLVVVLGIIGYLASSRKRIITKRKGIVCAICTCLQLLLFFSSCAY